jgi:hypothetical protein
MKKTNVHIAVCDILLDLRFFYREKTFARNRKLISLVNSCHGKCDVSMIHVENEFKIIAFAKKFSKNILLKQIKEITLFV